MSDPNGPLPPDHTEATAPVETQPGETPALRKPRKPAIIAAVAGGVALLLIVGGGAWAFTTLVLGKGQSVAASAVAFPGSTVGWAELAIDPSNDQKLAALGFTGKLTGLEDALAEAGIDLDLSDGANTDLKKSAWDAFVSAQTGDATTLDYDKDIKPWLGSRIAVGLLENPVAGEQRTIVAIESSDAAAAKKALTTLVSESDETQGWTVGEHSGYALLGSEGVDLNEEFRTGTLASNEEFSAAAAKSGEWGLVSGWTGPGFAATVSNTDEAAAAATKGGSQFAVVRLVDGTLELSGSSTGVESGPELGDAGSAVGTLPASTMLAGSYGSLGVLLDYLLSDNDTAAALAESYSSYLGTAEAGATPEEQIANSRAAVSDFFQTTFGLAFPDDVDSLFGESLTIVVDSAVSTTPSGSTENPVTEVVGSGVAIVVTSADAAATAEKWNTVLDAYAAQLGGELGLTVTVADNRVIIGAGKYADALAGPAGTLGSSKRAATVLPDLDGASGVLYLDVPAALATYGALIGDAAGEASSPLGAFDGLSAIGITTTRVSDTESSYRMRISTEGK